MAPVDELMRRAVTDAVFPGAVLLVSKSQRIVLHEAYGLANLETQQATRIDTFYDLASLTKPLATTLAVLKLVAAGKLKLEDCLGDVLPSFIDTEKRVIEIQHLLCHTAGLPDWRPYYQSLSNMPLSDRSAALQKCLMREPLVAEPSSECRYSDIGFMILHWLVESLSGKHMDIFVHDQLYRPLGISDLFYLPSKQSRPPRLFAATERCEWRERLLIGAVHDENAYAMGGVAGQSGLFGTAAAVHQLLCALLDIYHEDVIEPLLPSALVRQAFAGCSVGQRAFGFDRPEPDGSSSGDRFSQSSIGHLGFTGTSFWVDLKQGIIVILLSNRVHPSRSNEAIKTFRPRLHNAIMSGLLDAR